MLSSGVYVFGVFLRSKAKKCTIQSHVVSGLSESNKPWDIVFDFSIALYGLLSVVIPISLINLMDVNIFIFSGALFLFITGCATIFAGLIPVDKNTKIHNAMGGISFVNILFASIVFTWIFNNNFMPILKWLNLGIVITTILLCINSLMKRKTNPFLEWLVFTGSIIWNFLLALSLLTIVNLI